MAGGVDANVSNIVMGGFTACKALSQRNDEPTRASRPWDKGRDGFVMGEGAGVIVMEVREGGGAWRLGRVGGPHVRVGRQGGWPP